MTSYVCRIQRHNVKHRFGVICAQHNLRAIHSMLGLPSHGWFMYRSFFVREKHCWNSGTNANHRDNLLVGDKLQQVINLRTSWLRLSVEIGYTSYSWLLKSVLVARKVFLRVGHNNLPRLITTRCCQDVSVFSTLKRAKAVGPSASKVYDSTTK